MPELTRRDVLLATGSLGAAAACLPSDGGQTDAGLDSDLTDDTEVPGPPWCDVVAGTEAEGWTRIPLSDHPGLEQVGGGANVRIGGDSVNLLHVEEGCFVAMGTVCTHEGCAVAIQNGRFVCPCHGALYNWLGEPIAGPAPDPLPTWPAARHEGAIWVHKA